MRHIPHIQDACQILIPKCQPSKWHMTRFQYRKGLRENDASKIVGTSLAPPKVMSAKKHIHLSQTQKISPTNLGAIVM